MCPLEWVIVKKFDWLVRFKVGLVGFVDTPHAPDF